MDSEKSALLTCTFCGKELSKDEMVRYRGALSCRSCAQSQEPIKDFKERPFFLLGALGTLVGLFVVTISVIEALTFVPMQFDIYTPHIAFYFGGMSIAILLQGFGIYALNRSRIYVVAIIGALTAVGSAISQIIALLDLTINGPYYVISDITLTKGFGYYSYTTTTYMLFSLAAGIGILLLMSTVELDTTSVATGALYLVGGSLGVFGYLWPPVGFLHILMYAVAFVFFFTRKEIVEPQPIETLGYGTIDG